MPNWGPFGFIGQLSQASPNPSLSASVAGCDVVVVGRTEDVVVVGRIEVVVVGMIDVVVVVLTDVVVLVIIDVVVVVLVTHLYMRTSSIVPLK